MVKIRLIGGVGSGKTYLARRIESEHGISHLLLDDIVWDNDADDYCTKKPAKERDALLQEILKKKDWVIDGVYYESWTKKTFSQADVIIALQVPRPRRWYRVLKRYLVARIKGENVPERSLKDVFTIFKLDRGWEDGIRKASKDAKKFKSADEAYRYLEQRVL